MFVHVVVYDIFHYILNYPDEVPDGTDYASSPARRIMDTSLSELLPGMVRYPLVIIPLAPPSRRDSPESFVARSRPPDIFMTEFGSNNLNTANILAISYCDNGVCNSKGVPGIGTRIFMVTSSGFNLLISQDSSILC